MNRTSRRHSLIAALMIAIGIAVTGSTAVIAQLPASCGTAPGQLNCFDPWAAGEMWRALVPMMSRTTPDLKNGVPDPATASPVMTEDDEGNPVILLNAVGDEVWQSNATTLTQAKSEVATGECTFSHLGDQMLPELPALPDPAGINTRVCRASKTLFVPPPTGKLFYPSGIAVYKGRVYVSDRMNHRVQVVDFFGTPLSIAKPIGNGEPGTGTYTTLYPSQTVAGSRLSAPNGLAVDASNRVLVADGGNQRIAIFNGLTGDPAFTTTGGAPLHKAVTAGVSGGTPTPTTVAISPNAVVLAPGTVPTGAAANHRIVVIDRYTCSMKVYDTGFNELWQYPTQKPAGTEPGISCVDASASSDLGNFSLMTGAAIDTAGRIFVVDSWNNRIQVFTKEGVLLGAFGAPLDPDNSKIEDLATPSSVLIDHNGRIVVNDSDKLRIAFYTVTFGPGPTAQFLFEVPVAGDDMEEFPTGLAEQWGTTAEGLDPAGRYLRVDTAGHRVQRLQLADLAIVQASAMSGTGNFTVAVPSEKANGVADVHASVVPGYLDETDRLVNPYTGVVVGPVTALAPGTGNDDISPGASVRYQFTYVNPRNLPEIQFVVSAVGNEATPQPTVAPSVVVNVRGDCSQCDASVAIYRAAAPTALATAIPTLTGSWYNEKVLARLTPTGVNASRVQFIEWTVAGSDLQFYGTGVHQSLMAPGALSVDVAFQGRNSDLTFWAVLDDNTVGPRHTRNIKVDREAPTVTFNIMPRSGLSPDGSSWWKTDVSGTYTVVDDGAGVDTASGVMPVISGTGRNLFVSVTTTDRVGNTGESRSDDTVHGGKVVNIDRAGPVITPPAGLFLIAGTDGLAQVPASYGISGTATDALSGLNGPVIGTGLATVAAGTTATWTFTATDWAGNTSSATSLVTVASSALIYTGPPSVEYGQSVALSAKLEPADAQGTFRFTLTDAVRGTRVVTSGPIVNGVASASLASVVNNVGSYTLMVEYLGTSVVVPPVTTPFQVRPAPYSIDASSGKGKIYGTTTEPVLTYHLPVAPYHAGDVITGQLSRVAGENAGSYAITLGTLAINSNYLLILHSQPFVISKRLVNVTADSLTKLVGVADVLPLKYTVEAATATTGLVNGGTITGSLVRVSGETVGEYLITNTGPNPLTAGSNYTLNVTPGVMTIVANIPGNLAPTAMEDTVTTPAGTAVSIGVLDNDSDPDGDNLIVVSATVPAHGTVSTNGTTITYAPSTGYVGPDSFSYTITDSRGGSATGIVSITVEAATASGDYRMTGGGTFGSATHGFGLHCNVQQNPNRLEVNWGKGNKFSLTTLTAATCWTDTTIKSGTPSAPFNTYKGSGTGRYNGAPATAEFTFTDAGEPGTADYATIVIRDANGAVVLSTSGLLSKGNQQAHK